MAMISSQQMPTAAATTDGSLAFGWPWLVVALAILTIAVLVGFAIYWNRPGQSQGAYVAHTERLRSLPRYRSLVRQRVTFGILIAIALIPVLVGTAIIAGRPQTSFAQDQNANSRDIMLCLDASTSMALDNVDVTREMQRIIKGLDGERVGLTIWSRSAITIFPLTDDYKFALAELKRGEKAFRGVEAYLRSQDEADLQEYLEFTAGTQRMDANAKVLSQIGDGLASCTQRMGPEEGRGRAIILASDNEPYGTGVFSLKEASDFAIKNQVIVHGIGARGFSFADELDEMEQEVTKTGGIFGEVGGTSADEIVAKINELEAAKVEKPPLVQPVDRPKAGIIIASIGMVLLALVAAVQVLVRLADRRRS